METLTNIDSLGMGYDPFIGNPHTNEMDPGFKLPVIDLTYNKVSFTF
jgi:hypothetical protein